MTKRKIWPRITTPELGQHDSNIYVIVSNNQETTPHLLIEVFSLLEFNYKGAAMKECAMSVFPAEFNTKFDELVNRLSQDNDAKVDYTLLFNDGFRAYRELEGIKKDLRKILEKKR